MIRSFVAAVGRGDRATIEQWIAEDRVEWHSSNFVGRSLSEEVKAKRRAEAEADGEPTEPEPARIKGVGEDEAITHSHPVIQSAIRRGDGAALAELMADERYEAASGSGPMGAFTWADLEARHSEKEAS